jgi:ParB family chromosome partitioning protein
MKLAHIDFEQLKPSDLNVRKHGHKDVADLLPSIRSLGILQPLLVRPDSEGFEIVAGRRRYNALAVLRQNDEFAETVPCMIMEDGDDARAVEASLTENIARLPMDEIDQYKAFAALVAKGMNSDDIAAHFGISERAVNQRLAIANIIEPILNAYRREEVDVSTLRSLTMATRKQQNAWWKLFKSEDEYAPTGRSLKAWLLGGSQVRVSNAIFDLTAYRGAIISDLFGEERYFADASEFWTLQNAAVAAAAQRYRDAGWYEVIVLGVGEQFQSWNHQKTAKKTGGRVFIAISHDGEVVCHEGYLSHKEVQRQARSEQDNGEEPQRERPELTQAMQNYLSLHRHAAVRTELLSHPGLALRLAVAHMIAGSSLWRVEAEPQRAENEAIAVSLATSPAAERFATERVQVMQMLGLDCEHATLARQRYGLSGAYSLEELHTTLLGLSDADVLRVLTCVMAETLEAGTPLTDTIGVQIGTEMKNWWAPDQTFIDLLRDREATTAILRSVAGDATADAHQSSTLKAQKKIILDCVSAPVNDNSERWLPRYLAFPPEGYTKRFRA